jgi:hypothetical protein
LRRSGRKRRKVNYSDTERRKKKQRDMSGKKGFFPKGQEIPRSLSMGTYEGAPIVEDAESVTSDASTTTPSTSGAGQTHTLDSLANMISQVVSQNHTIVQKFDAVQDQLSHHTNEIRRIDRRIEETERNMEERMCSLTS